MAKTLEEERTELKDLLRRQDKEAHARDHHRKGSKRRARAKRRLRRLRGLIATAQQQVAKLFREEAKQGPRAATAFFKRKEGLSEHPADSNMGPGKNGITEAERFTGYDPPPGVFWCGCWVCLGIVKFGKAKIQNKIRLGYTGYIEADAKAHTNGLKQIATENITEGCIGTLYIGHIVYFAGKPYRRSGVLVVDTEEGNTSPDDAGSQFNGGCTASKTRPVSMIKCAAEVKYPS